MLPRSWFCLGLIFTSITCTECVAGSLGRGSWSYSALQGDFKGQISFSLTEEAFCAYPRGGDPAQLSQTSFVPDGVRKICPVFFWGWEGKGEGTIHFSSFPWPSWLNKGNHENAAVSLDPRSSDSFPPQDTRGREWREEIYQILCPSNPSCGVASVWLRLFSITRGGLALKMQLVLKEKPQLAANNNRGILCWMRHLFCGYTQSNFCKEKGLDSVGYSFIWKRTDH